MPDSTPTAATPAASRPRRGRPPAGDRERRRQLVLDAAFAELVEHGADGVTMASIARRANASKETLYAWFGNRAGLFSAMISANADATSDGISRALADSDDPGAALRLFGAGLLRLLVDPKSVTLNRAAMTDTGLAAELLASGRHRVGPLVESFLADAAERGYIRIDDPGESFELFYGLLVRDTQIRVLLGEPGLTDDEIVRRADDATTRFLQLVGPDT